MALRLRHQSVDLTFSNLRLALTKLLIQLEAPQTPSFDVCNPWLERRGGYYVEPLPTCLV